MITDTDLTYLRRAVDLAAQALEAGDEPFGSVLVSAEGEVLFEDHNHVVSGDGTQHPEIAIARWAGANLSLEQRAAATVYTSGEHCAMCSAAHGWVGLGRIVIAASTDMFVAWREELGRPPGPVAPLPITTVLPGALVDGPVPELAAEVGKLYKAF
ncbi:nucleoside deaminase [Solirubrobacter sp. CPCC 204708]|uniref:Nucleoside deaminase n=1 Tax=Solirubrobacter deserti TaxID=2282478 RepID=A0ABT4RS80_9ACTN|nr:nucleoside deaminase [Solirubrobacter deserti]MBE2319886.1 nucleoside deaminase [Solirubrobacter deserti]MDA0141419.1 nucleoside deaminase [Solirubrobacter deserti]